MGLGGGGGREVQPYKKTEGPMLSGTKILFCGPGVKFVSPLKGTNSFFRHFYMGVSLGSGDDRKCGWTTSGG